MISVVRLAAKRLRFLSDIYFNTGNVSVPYQTVTIETTSICNLNCPICPSRRSENTLERASKQIKLDDVRRIVDLTREITESYCLNIFGEPLLHKEFNKILEYVSSTNLRIWLSTNLNYSARLAEALTPFPLLNIICSLDGWDAESYSEYRWDGRFDVVRRNLAILAKGKCKVYPQYLLTPGEADSELRKERFLDFVRTTIGTTENVIFKKKNPDFKNDGDDIVPGRCSSLYGGLYFNCDGILMPCCNNVRSDVFLNHISSYTTEMLRNGREVNQLRRLILDDKNQFASCRSCPGEDHQAMIFTKLSTRSLEIFSGQRKELGGSSQEL
jgi:pyruvate-formate lyase-activating enzyme